MTAQKIVLIGMMGAGKSAVGAELARRLGTRLVDTDAEIERAAAMRIPEIFARDGEAFFRAREAEVLARLLEGEARIIATGGGAWMNEANQIKIRQHGRAVWLDAGLATLWNRLKGKAGRPLLETEDPRARLAELLAQRRPVYARADLRVAVGPNETVPETAQRVLDALAADRPDDKETI